MEIYVVKAGDTLGTTAACRYISDKETDIGDYTVEIIEVCISIDGNDGIYVIISGR